MTATKKQPREFEAEFVRFSRGHLYTVTFTEYGEILSATIYVPEMHMHRFNGEVDVTAHIKADPYWQNRVDEYLQTHTDVMREHRLFKQHKEREE